jgi:hypothetical protein
MPYFARKLSDYFLFFSSQIRNGFYTQLYHACFYIIHAKACWSLLYIREKRQNEHACGK